MDTSERIDLILGEHLSQEEKESTFLDVERRLLEKLARQFSLSDDERALIVTALYQFRQTCRHYITLWKPRWVRLPQELQEVSWEIFPQMDLNLDRESRSCFSKETFFRPIRFMLQACSKLEVDPKHRRKYLEWLLSFPIVPTSDIGEVLEHKLARSVFPHVYMHMLAGFVRAKLVDERLDHRRLCFRYKKFQKELNVKEAHARWFEARFPGSYGSRQ